MRFKAGDAANYLVIYHASATEVTRRLCLDASGLHDVAERWVAMLQAHVHQQLRQPPDAPANGQLSYVQACCHSNQQQTRLSLTAEAEQQGQP